MPWAIVAEPQGSQAVLPLSLQHVLTTSTAPRVFPCPTLANERELFIKLANSC